jgi:hypothetical protein
MEAMVEMADSYKSLSPKQIWIFFLCLLLFKLPEEGEVTQASMEAEAMEVPEVLVA